MNKLKQRPQRRENRGLDNFSQSERFHWGCNGPSIFGECTDSKGRKFPKGEKASEDGRIVWGSWEEFMDFYAAVRVPFLEAWRPTSSTRSPVCERLFQAWQTSGLKGIAREQAEIARERKQEQRRLYALLA